MTPELVVFYINRQGAPIDKIYTPYAINEIPILYGLSSVESLDVNVTGISPTLNLDNLQLTGIDVIIAIVDTGIDYTHPAFINKDKTTKILHIWDQTGNGPSPEGFDYGTEYNSKDINNALQTDDPISVLPSTDDVGHGTYLAGIAAGSEVSDKDFKGIASEASLIVVKLKPAKEFLRKYYFIQDDSIPVYQNTDVISGVKYALQKSAQYGKPVVLLYPGETNMSTHSGSSYLTEYISSRGNIPGLINITSAGNEATSNRHFRGNYYKVNNDKITMQVNVPENVPGFVISVLGRSPDRLTISAKTPLNNFTENIPLYTDRVQEIFFMNEPVSIFTEYQMLYSPEGGDLSIFVAVKKPTPGTWDFTVFGERIINGIFDAYIFMFVDEKIQFLEPSIFVTCTDPGSGENIITVGGYNSLTGELYQPTGRGPTRTNLLKPDFVAPCVNIIGPLPNNRYGTLLGTSVSAAITAGASALLLEWGIIKGNKKNLDTIEAKKIFINGTTKKEDLVYPNVDWGYGELNLSKAIEVYKKQSQ